MNNTSSSNWQRFRHRLCFCPSIDVRVDVSRMNFDDAWLTSMNAPMAAALQALARLEKGAIANPTENRMVGHYWLRAPELAPSPEIGDEIRSTVARIKEFAGQVHEGGISSQRGEPFYVVLLIGIGGSALGPALLSSALSQPDDPMIIRFLDNTDPDGIARTLSELEEMLDQTLTIVVSKSGDTVETRNGMLETAAAYRRAGLNFAQHAVAITCAGSKLDQKAVQEKWLASFPIWAWVGGRVSITSAVGLLPLALLGGDVDAFLSGAGECDVVTREAAFPQNPAAVLAAMWHHARSKQDKRNMVVLPYRDRLELLSRYLQQLVMESLGKRVNRRGDVVHQGLSVFGNKGSTDQHSFVQQLREGPNDFFVTFIDVLRAGEADQPPTVEPDVSSGDYLYGFMHGTRNALYEQGRQSITITLDTLDARTLGILIALFERVVGLYAELNDINAYDQPGVEAGKKAAAIIIDLQRRTLAFLRSHVGKPFTAEEVESSLHTEDAEQVWHVLEHLAASSIHNVTSQSAPNPFDNRYLANS